MTFDELKANDIPGSGCDHTVKAFLITEIERLHVENADLKEDNKWQIGRNVGMYEALEYYAKLKWFVDDGKYIYKVAENALAEAVRG